MKKISVFSNIWHLTIETEILLSEAFIFLNLVTDCYKSGVNIMLTLQGTTTAEAAIPYTL
jgi:hypothetical protein